MPAPEWKSRRVFRAADFVFFSHGSHASAKVECASCHGAVYRTNALKHEGQMKMSYCMDCHKQRRATIECNACHELAQ